MSYLNFSSFLSPHFLTLLREVLEYEQGQMGSSVTYREWDSDRRKVARRVKNESS
jgi:hypothetical protein